MVAFNHESQGIHIYYVGNRNLMGIHRLLSFLRVRMKLTDIK